ncbi:hypothetical protein GOP47_0003978 [Adiantum capillus-veneris]|uniref:Tyrosinase copper-binding domain-containing protein n=1 Tax=Adiantum capillus-veneris TaxID=13818 RepID=A0A9D4V7B7_ADICA|nr:hypothetical protein GOP47_0003978 [Adiantum capillus-veneris]
MATSISWARGSLLQAEQLIPCVSFLFTLLLFTVSTGSASPIGVPDLQQCEPAMDVSPTNQTMMLTLNCCLPIPAHKPRVFSFHKYKSKPRVRQAAHTVSDAYIAKYTRAYELMKALPDDDPRSFHTQAKIHCAFCNFAYRQAGNTSVPLQVHFSWLFLPWHRWYLYWHERILQSLLGDPTFTLVFWNWDDQRDGGNVMPAMFVPNGTALYDRNRNQNNLPPALVKLSPTTTGNDSVEIVNQNLNDMYRDVVTATTAELFMGDAYRTGTDITNSTVITAPLEGLIEGGVHNGIHYWTGDPNLTLMQDMGTFTTASRDPIFYAHHSNVDRLWDKWKYDLPGGPRADHNDSDFLDAEFYFYDEKARLVKVTVRDALDNSKLGISYPSVAADELWVNYDPPVMSNGSAVEAARAVGVATMGAAPQNGTIFLGSGRSAIVKAPSFPPSTTTKATVLVIQGLQVTRRSFVSLTAFVNLPSANALTDTSTAEYLGTFNIIPTASIKYSHLTTNVMFEISNNMQRIGITHEHEVVITMVVTGVEPVSIQGLLIENV